MTLIAKRPHLRWPTVVPFAILYLIAFYIIMNPEEIWGATQYLLHQSHIDFLHAALIPLVLFSHGFTSFFTVWSVKFKVACLFDKLTVSGLGAATHVFAHTAAHKGDSQIVQLLSAKAPHGTPRSQISSGANGMGVAGNVYFFNFQQRKWVFDFEKKQFVKPVFPDQLAFASYVKNGGFESQQAMTTAANSFGKNILPLDVPEFLPLLVDHMFQPFFVFQMFCVLLWCLDEYWMYSLFTGFMMFVMEGTVVFQRIRNMKSLREMGQVPVIPVIVKRAGVWRKIASDELLPLDLLVIPNNTHCPADCVLVSGTCVMNEAMLTGESTPQLKEAVPDEADQFLDTRRDTRHLLFGGTQVLLSAGETDVPALGVKTAALGVVLRTGFETKQGKLLRTILHSQGRISENSGEAFAFIGILVIFALMASGYLLRRGLADPTKDRWKLFLHCTQIITSVVPTELPMELSLAVNASLVTLMKLRVFCTEPFRIPYAGRLDTCCFDKTGTITTDEMLFSGVDLGDGKGLRFKMEEVPKISEQILAGCHALVHLEGSEVAGDAMEKAAVTALGYACTKDDTVVKNAAVVTKDDDKADGKKKAPPTASYTIAARFPFSPVLRRMSTVIIGGTASSSSEDRLIVCKGSPEGLKTLCGATIPADYDAIYQRYASKGLRVIALAYKTLPAAYKTRAQISEMEREEAESGLTFAGFALFNCPLKKDAEETIRDLIGGSHRCVIITGDSIQTALAVGRMVGIAPSKRHIIARTAGGKKLKEANKDCSRGKNQSAPFPVKLVDAEAIGSPSEPVVGSPNTVDAIAASNSDEGIVMSVGDVLSKAYLPLKLHKSTPAQRAEQCEKKIDICVDADGMTPEEFAAVVKASAHVVSVWARCNPTQKEDIISHLKAIGHCVLMAGDGTNDVGGLKQADVGVAVLNANAMEQAKKEVEKRKEQVAQQNPEAAARLKEQAEADAKDPTLPPLPPGAKLIPIPAPLPPNCGFMERVRHDMQLAQRKAQIMHFEKLDKANKEKLARGEAITPAAAAGAAGANGVAKPPADASFSSLMESAFNSDFEDDQNTMVKLGDASIAAPFTAKSRRLMAIVDIVRNGRSTLVTTLQMYKILALNCLVTAYTMSVLHSDGVKMGDKQMMVTGVIMTICFLTMSRCKPVDRLSSQQPVTKVFHPATIISIFGQFALHLYSIMTAVSMVLGTDSEAIDAARAEIGSADFKPSLLNTIVFFVQTTMTATTFFVNYRGEPFMQDIKKNRPMFFSLMALVAIVFYLALEIDPEMNEFFEIVPMPSEEFKSAFLQLLVVDMVGAFVIEKLCLKLLTDG